LETASLVRWIGKWERHPKACRLKRVLKVQACLVPEDMIVSTSFSRLPRAEGRSLADQRLFIAAIEVFFKWKKLRPVMNSSFVFTGEAPGLLRSFFHVLQKNFRRSILLTFM
jgi:hypothetical protein